MNMRDNGNLTILLKEMLTQNIINWLFKVTLVCGILIFDKFWEILMFWLSGII